MNHFRYSTSSVMHEFAKSFIVRKFFGTRLFSLKTNPPMQKSNLKRNIKYVFLAASISAPLAYYQTLDSYEKRQVDVTLSGIGRFFR